MTDTPTLGRDVEVEVTIAASPDVVFDYFVDPAKLVSWKGVAVDIDPQPGGRFLVHMGGDDVAEGAYVEVEPPERLVFTWGWVGSDAVPPGSSTVTVTLRPEGDGTVVTLVHTGLPAGEDDQHEGGWRYFLPRLVIAAEGGDPEGDNSNGD